MGAVKLNPKKEVMLGKQPVGVQRSPKWDNVRKAHLKVHPKCEVCEGTKQLNVHHIKPFHLHPELELEPSNLITLCECLSYGINCHLLIGHLGNYKNINPSSIDDAKTWNSKLKQNNTKKK
jgi:predicted TIM-barrel fold metal-dependent hydrolase